jgi:hypothetical protein
MASRSFRNACARGFMVPGVAFASLFVFGWLGTGSLACAQPADCQNSEWDLSAEARLFSEAPTALNAGADGPTAPTLELTHLYALSLRRAQTVVFPASERALRQSDTHAGVAVVEIARAGRYRVSVDAPVWIDVIGPAGFIRSAAFQGHRACRMIHKVVEFELPIGHALVQVTGGTAQFNIAITAAPTANVPTAAAAGAHDPN